MVKRSGSRRSSRRISHYGRSPIARLGGELSSVINRVRRAFGPFSMRDSSTRPEIRRVEEAVDQVARGLLRGDVELTDWYRALRQYEDTWMVQLEMMRRMEAERRAA